MFRVLIVDDDRAMCELLDAGLTGRGYRTRWFTSGTAALAALAVEEFDAVVTDVRLDGENGLDLCRDIVVRRPDLPVVVMTAFGSQESAVAALRARARDFLSKPFALDELAATLARALVRRSAGLDTASSLVGDSASMAAVRDLVSQLAASDASVLVTGETGTGKELVARALHNGSGRKSGRFVAVNCAALPEALVEAELFGYVRGAFTGADRGRDGLLRQADGGTLFLDEIGELPRTAQAKLLRALEERTIRPVGGDREVPFDARIVAATNRDLPKAVEQDQFRRDLLFRVQVAEIDLPPLRDHPEDIALLAQRFIERLMARPGPRVAGLAVGAEAMLRAYPWPGNVRELRNCIERAVALARGARITVDDLPKRIAGNGDSTECIRSAEWLPVEELERRHILRVVESVGGKRAVAARILGVSRKTLYRKLRSYVGST